MNQPTEDTRAELASCVARWRAELLRVRSTQRTVPMGLDLDAALDALARAILAATVAALRERQGSTTR